MFDWFWALLFPKSKDEREYQLWRELDGKQKYIDQLVEKNNDLERDIHNMTDERDFWRDQAGDYKGLWELAKSRNRPPTEDELDESEDAITAKLVEIREREQARARASVPEGMRLKP